MTACRWLTQRRVELIVVVLHRGVARRLLSLEINACLNWQHIESLLRAERDFAREHLSVAVEGEGLQGAAFVGEDNQTSRRRGGVERDTQQRKKFSAVAIGNLVAPVEQVLRQEREDFQERDPRVAGVEVGPFRIVDGNARERFVQQLLVLAVVKCLKG